MKRLNYQTYNRYVTALPLKMSLHATLHHFRMLALGAMINLVLASTLMAAIVDANPDNYRSKINTLKAGDTLQLTAGIYQRGLSLSNLHGTLENPIIITGPENGEPAVFTGRSCCNTVQIGAASYVVIRHLKLDGLEIPYVDAVNSRGVTHHITLENLLIVNHGGSGGPDSDHQLTVGIATRAPAWDWVIRNNVIIGAGTGIYLGDSNGREPFVRGVIERNVIMDTLGYNMQIKHQQPRPTDVGLPTGDNKTIIRHNVFSKANNSSLSGTWARPNLLVGHWPLTGPGRNDQYEIYGNFFYENPSEALFQGEGNIALYANVFVNSSGSAVNIQPHNEVPRAISVFNNTVVASGSGVRVTGVHVGYDQQVVGNALFAARSVNLADNVQQRDNITGSYAQSSNYFINSTGNLGMLDLYPLLGKLQGDVIERSAFQPFTDWSLDFNGQPRDGTYRGAYSGSENNPGWLLARNIKPGFVNVAPSIIAQPEAITVTEGEDATFSVIATGSAPLTYQWLRNGSSIPDATRASYTVTAAGSSDNDSDYRVEVSNNEADVVSDEVGLTVVADEIAPTLISAVAVNNTRVDLTFSEAVSTSSAETRTNYQIDVGLTVTAANLSDEGRIVSLTVSPLSENTAYTVSVSNVQDRAQSPNTIDNSSNITFTYRDVDDFEDGNANGWSPLTSARWEVKEDIDGDNAYWLNTTAFNSLYIGALGEYALLAADYGDFTFNVQARLGDNVGDNSLADYAVVFGYQDAKHYYYVMFNNTPGETQLFKVINGTRTKLAAADSAIDWLNDNAYHSVEVSRMGSTITVRFDGREMLSVNDDSLVRVGQVGVGSFNDSAYFDDVSVTGDATTDPVNRVPSTPSTPRVTLTTN